MSFTILLLSPDADPSWPEKIRRAVPGATAKIQARYKLPGKGSWRHHRRGNLASNRRRHRAAREHNAFRSAALT
jgi:hypothetical protein